MMSALVFLSCRVSDTLGAIVVPSVSNNRPCSHHVQASSMITGPFLSLRIIIRLSHPSSSAWTISLVSNASIASHPREWVTKRSYDVYDNAMVFLWEQDKMQVNQLFGFGQRYKKSFFYQRTFLLHLLLWSPNQATVGVCVCRWATVYPSMQFMTQCVIRFL